MKTRTIQNSILGMCAACAVALGAQGQTFRHITVDGNMSDWAGIQPAYTDPQDSANSLDYENIYVANDENYLYIRFTIFPSTNATFMNPSLGYNNLFIDTDATFGTGKPVGGQLGSDLFLQNGNGYQQDNTPPWYVGSVDGLNWSISPTPNGTASDFEVRISRSATYHDNGTPVFAGDTIGLMYEAETTGWSTAEVAPDWSTFPPLTYIFAPTPQPFPGPSLTLVNLTSTSAQVNDSGSDLGTDWALPGYEDTQSGWSAGEGLFGFTTQPGAYPAIQKSLATGANTYYFRTHFQWDYNSANTVFVVTNYLSDGAVYYLNGVEIRRVRMPAGTINNATSATAANSPVGNVEVFGLPAGLVFPGDNILAVETHQAPSSGSDMVLGLSVTALTEYAPVIVDASQPADRTVVSGQPTTFSAEVLGQPIAYQWLKNSTPIADATNATYSIAAVLSTDAADFALRVSNALSTNTSRAAVLTVTVLPASIDDPALPADLTIAQGKPASFAVVASGSELHYQWFKGVSPLADATNATYEIASAVIADSGNYSCVVTNPVSSTNSRTAVLNVVVDTVLPTIASVSGCPNKVIINFSEPVDAATALNAANYSLNRGVIVSNAVQDTPQQITLNTSPQTRGAAYLVSVSQVQDLFGNAILPNSQRGFVSTIFIDGSFDDWQGMSPVYSGPSNSPAATNFKDLWVFNDANYFYFRLTTWDPTVFNIWYNNLFFDGDNNTNSGYIRWGGSEMLIQNGNGYQEKNGAFNEGGINGLDWLCVPTTSGTDFEFRFSRAATYVSDSGQVFTTNVINFIFDGESTGYVALNRMPTNGSIAYVIVEPEPLPLGPLTISPGAGSVTVTWPGAGTLQSCYVASGGTWTNVPAATNPCTIPATQARQFFRLVP